MCTGDSLRTALQVRLLLARKDFVAQAEMLGCGGQRCTE